MEIPHEDQSSHYDHDKDKFAYLSMRDRIELGKRQVQQSQWGSKYVLNEDISMKAKLASMARRIEEFELRNVHTEAQPQAMPTSFEYINHPNLATQPQPQPSMSTSSLEQAILKISKVMEDFVGEQQKINSHLNEKIDNLESSINVRMEEVYNDLSLRIEKVQDSIENLTNLDIARGKRKLPPQPHHNLQGTNAKRSRKVLKIDPLVGDCYDNSMDQPSIENHKVQDDKGLLEPFKASTSPGKRRETNSLGPNGKDANFVWDPGGIQHEVGVSSLEFYTGIYGLEKSRIKEIFNQAKERQIDHGRIGKRFYAMTLNVTEPNIHDFGKLNQEQETLQLSVLFKMANGSLEDRIFRRGDFPLSWQPRFRIAAEISTGLLFPHQTKSEPQVHHDLKLASILLDPNYVSKISDVGLVRLVPLSVADSVTQYQMKSTAGNFCYIDPEYQQAGMLGIKSDVYSLGIMLLQIITAKPPMELIHLVERAIRKVVHAILNTIAEEAMNFMSYVAEVSRGWDEPNARDMERMTSQPNAKGEMYILNDDIDMKAKIAAMERRLEELDSTHGSLALKAYQQNLYLEYYY
ncbi:hypothetical protein VitviT2T_018140 [Vitis vinifera]|uniref:RING-type E3 ubiquitin transferase n=1 Tax=Vitis vinifera TaxID=29760 RepID=A0ABY9CX54_VITVI|nr:hypothetical protein VitviT2T_018140 [Vitis vinifera]